MLKCVLKGELELKYDSSGESKDEFDYSASNQENEKENDEWLSNALQKRRMINHKLALENDNL